MKIETGVPIAKKGAGRPSKYPFAQMKVGESFACDEPVLRLRQAASQASHRKGMKFTVRAEGTGARVWRTE